MREAITKDNKRYRGIPTKGVDEHVGQNRYESQQVIPASMRATASSVPMAL
jgi:hypothetical protein